MNLMKSKIAHSLIVCLIFIAGYLPPVTAVTDAELEALEKQIEQQEVEEKQQAEAEAKRKAEQKRKAEEKRLSELEKHRLEEEQKRLEEARSKREEEKRKLEQARQAELERKRQEEEKRLVEEETKRKEEERTAKMERNRKKYLELTGEMVDIPGGSFQMGSNNGHDVEKPVHSVTIKPFRLGKYEVTQSQWQAMMGGNPADFKNCGDDCPVEQVSWDDVQSFIKELNQKTEGHYRLPTEAEWEYACRSGGQSQKYCGGNSPGNIAWSDGNSGDKTHPVGQKQSNGMGLYDMSGNVHEWMEDCFHGNYSGAPSDGRAWLTGGDCNRRVFRGGSWSSNDTDGVAFYNRIFFPRMVRNFGIGFRLAHDK
jgi:formylglycine-generating enzyme required for sulfatase activity